MHFLRLMPGMPVLAAVPLEKACAGSDGRHALSPAKGRGRLRQRAKDEETLLLPLSPASSLLSAWEVSQKEGRIYPSACPSSMLACLQAVKFKTYPCSGRW